MTPRDRRALWIGGGIVAAAVLTLRLVPAGWRAWREASATIAGQEALLVRAERTIAGLDSVEARAAAVRASVVGLAPRLLSGATDAEAMADLNGRIALAASRNRTRLMRADPLADSASEARLRRVRLRVEVESDWSGFAAFLGGTLDDPAALRITAIAVRGSEVPTGSTGPEVLTGEIEVTGWYLRGTATTRGGDR